MKTTSIDVTVRYFAGAYHARIQRMSGSSTADRETAVVRAAEKYAHANCLVLLRIERIGTERYRVFTRRR